MHLRRTVSAMLASAGVVVVVSLAAGQTVVPRDWRRLKVPPTLNSREDRCAGLADAFWRVEFKGGVLAASRGSSPDPVRDPVPYELDFDRAIDVPPPEPPDPRTGQRGEDSAVWARRYAREFAARRAVRVSDGWLIGFDGGEYGGSLWWYPIVAGSGTKLWERDVQAIEQLGSAGQYVVLSGLDHGDRSGTVLWVSHDRDGWGVRRRVELDGRVWAYAPHPEGLMIATRTRVSIVVAGGSVKHLVQTPVSATPTSLAVSPSGEVAVGRRFFVSLLRPRAESYDEELFIPPACKRFKAGDFECKCQGGA